MKFTLSWLSKFLKIYPNITIDQILEQLTMLGLEVESCTARTDLSGFKIAKIVEASKHPNADRLKLCRVDIGDSIIDVVCGAPNARADIYVVFATIGAIIPANQIEIKKSKIRDVESNGMLCSTSELKLEGIFQANDGIIELSQEDDPEVGSDFASFYNLNDQIIELSITPNRGDCLGVYGIARELAAAGLGELIIQNPKPTAITQNNTTATATTASTTNPKISIQIHIDHSGCYQFCGRHFANINNNFQTPKDIRISLLQTGQKSISPLVDITNYLSMCFNRPMHIYDADRLSHEVRACAAAGTRNQHEFTALNDVVYQVPGDAIVIASDGQIVSLAGIIGGVGSACQTTSKNVFLEIASFDHVMVAKTARELNIHTDARHKFERKPDLSNLVQMMHIASQMISAICGGDAGDAGEILDIQTQSPQPLKITLSLEKLYKYAGMPIPGGRVVQILTQLGFEVKNQTEQSIELLTPPWRRDIEIEEDVIGEIFRIFGHNNLPIKEIKANPIKPNLTNEYIAKILASRGLYEVMTWSFMNDDLAALFQRNVGEELIAIANPIFKEQSVMRTSLLPNLIDYYVKNSKRNKNVAGVFEVGLEYSVRFPLNQQGVVSMIRVGKTCDRNIFEKPREFDIFDIKSDIEEVIGVFNVSFKDLKIVQQGGGVAVIPGYYHTTRSGAIYHGDVLIGYFGQLHPKVEKIFGIRANICAAEIFTEVFTGALAELAKKEDLFISNFPKFSRDFAFLVDAGLTFGDIEKAIYDNCGEYLQAINLFDIYDAEGVNGENVKSIGFEAVFQTDHTFTEEETNTISEKLISTLTGMNCFIRDYESSLKIKK